MTIKNYYVEIHGDPTLFPAVISDRPLTAYYDEASPGGRIGGIFVPNEIPRVGPSNLGASLVFCARAVVFYSGKEIHDDMSSGLFSMNYVGDRKVLEDLMRGVGVDCSKLSWHEYNLILKPYIPSEVFIFPSCENPVQALFKCGRISSILKHSFPVVEQKQAIKKRIKLDRDKI